MSSVGVFSSCDRCRLTFVSNSLSVLSHFPRLVYFKYCETYGQIHHCDTALHDIVTSLNVYCFMNNIICAVAPHHKSQLYFRTVNSFK